MQNSLPRVQLWAALMMSAVMLWGCKEDNPGWLMDISKQLDADERYFRDASEQICERTIDRRWSNDMTLPWSYDQLVLRLQSWHYGDSMRQISHSLNFDSLILAVLAHFTAKYFRSVAQMCEWCRCAMVMEDRVAAVLCCSKILKYCRS